MSVRKGDPHRYPHSAPHSFSHGEGGHEQPRRMHAVKCHDNLRLPPPPHPFLCHNNPLWPLHVWLRKTISSDIIDVTDVIVIKLLACEGPRCHRAVWWIMGKVIACPCSTEAPYCNAQVIAFRAGQSVAHMHAHFIRSGLGVLTPLGTDGRGSPFSHNTNLPLFLQITGPKRPTSLCCELRWKKREPLCCSWSGFWSRCGICCHLYAWHNQQIFSYDCSVYSNCMLI